MSELTEGECIVNHSICTETRPASN